MTEPRGSIRVAYTIEQCWHRVPGGTAVAGIEMARALKVRPDVSLIGVAARHAAPPAPPWTPPIEVKHLPLPRLALYESWHRLGRPAVDRWSGPIDVIHATTIAMPPRSKPIVLTIHDLAFLKHPSHFTKRGLSFFRRGLKLALDNADRVLCSSSPVMDDCISAGFERERLRIVPLGIDASRATEEEVARARKKFGLTRPYILWTGTIEPRKNLGGLIEAFKSLSPDALLVLAGPEGWNEDLRTLIDPVKGSVKVLGFVDRTDLGPLYAGADVFCFPSFLEGFGFPVLEAMAQGTPVVTSRGTSTEEIAGDAAVLIDPHDPADIARGITSVLDDDDRARELSGAGIERAAGYTWERTAALVAQTYAEVAG